LKRGYYSSFRAEEVSVFVVVTAAAAVEGFVAFLAGLGFLMLMS
jgi:hypothetical protein